MCEVAKQMELYPSEDHIGFTYSAILGALQTMRQVYATLDSLEFSVVDNVLNNDVLNNNAIYITKDNLDDISLDEDDHDEK